VSVSVSIFARTLSTGRLAEPPSPKIGSGPSQLFAWARAHPGTQAHAPRANPPAGLFPRRAELMPQNAL
jgi:hypothetical protein